MRRIFAFITMVVTTILSILLMVQPIQESVNLSNDYGRGITLVYDINKRSETDSSGAADLTDIDIDQLIMNRLDDAGVRGAEVTLLNPGDRNYRNVSIDSQENPDGNVYQRVMVTLTQTSSSELDNIKQVIGSTGTLTVTDAENHAHTGTDFFASDTPAEVKYDNGVPYLLIYLKDESTWDSFKTEAEAVKESSLQKEMFIWRNFNSSTDSYEAAYPTDENVAPDTIVKSKILFRDSTDSAYSSDDVALKFTSYKDADNTSHSWTISSCLAFAASINAVDYGFDISLAYTINSVSPTLGTNALMYSLIGFGIGYVVLFAVLILIFGWAGVVSFVSNSAALTLDVFLLTLFGFEFSPAALIGLAVSVILGAAINVNYFQRVRNELSKGKDMVKANKDGYHKSFLLTVDLCAITFLFSLGSFFLVKDMTKVATGVLTIGAVVAFLIVNYFTKWMLFWLSTANATNGGTVHAFGLRSHKSELPLYVVESVDSLPHKEITEVQTKKYPKIGLIVSCAVAALSVVGLGIMGGVKGGDEMFNRSGTFSNQYRIDIMTTATGFVDSDPEGEQAEYDFTTDTGKNFTRYLTSYNAFGSLAETYAVSHGFSGTSSQEVINYYLDSTGLSFQDAYDNGNAFFSVETLSNDSQVIAGEGSFYVIYASYTLSSAPDSDALERLVNAGGAMDNLVNSNTYSSANNNMSLASDFSNSTLKEKYESKYRLVAGVSTSSAVAHYESWFFAGLALGVTIAALYVFLRFGLCAFLSFYGVNIAANVFVIALFSVCQIAFSPLTQYGLIMGSIVFAMFSLIFFHKNAEYLSSLKIKKTASVEQRYVIAGLSTDASKGLGITILTGILSFSVFGLALFGSGSVGMFIAFAIMAICGMAASYFLNPIFTPYLRTHIRFAKVSDRIEDTKKRRQNKPKKVIEADPNEPKETIIPGINDYKTW